MENIPRSQSVLRRPKERELHSPEQLDLIRQLHSGRDLSFSDAMFLATQLVHHGFSQADAVLTTLLREMPQASVRYYLMRLRKRHAAIQSLPALKKVFDDKQRMVSLYDHESSTYFIPGSFRQDTAVIVFTTVNNNFGFSNAILDSVLEDLGVSRLYLRDTSRFCYFRGVTGLCDSLLDLPSALMQLLEPRGIRQIVVTGFSSGGFPALYTAATLDAASCLCFSTYTDISADTTIPQPRLFQKISHEIDPSLRINTRDTIGKSKAIPGSFRLFYGDDHPIDRAHALQLADLPQLDLQAVDDCSHFATTTLMERGEFAPVFAEALTGCGADLATVATHRRGPSRV